MLILYPKDMPPDRRNAFTAGYNAAAEDHTGFPPEVLNQEDADWWRRGFAARILTITDTPT
jgi:hypothetical protein